MLIIVDFVQLVIDIIIIIYRYICVLFIVNHIPRLIFINICMYDIHRYMYIII